MGTSIHKGVEAKSATPMKFLGGMAGRLAGQNSGGGGMLGKALNPVAAIAGKFGAGPNTMVGKMLNPLSMIKR